MVVVIVTWWLASPVTIRHARLVQKIGQTVVGPLMAIGERGNPRTQYTGPEISSYLWPNGTLPNSEEFDSLVKSGFADYRLRVSGLVENPKAFSYAEIKAMPKQEQITEHFCIQGWSGVAKWGGVPMRHILDIVKPTAGARYAVFYSLSEGSAGGGYYDVHKMQNMRHELTILAYEMNGAPLSVLHGAPLRLRARTSWVSRWSSGLRRSSSCTISLTLALAKVATTKIMSSMDTVCQFEGAVARVYSRLSDEARIRP